MISDNIFLFKILANISRLLFESSSFLLFTFFWDLINQLMIEELNVRLTDNENNWNNK